MTISSPGIGSNLDVNAIVTQLMAIESQPLTAIDTKTQTIQSKISAMGAVKSTLSAFKDAIAGLSSTSGLQPFTSTSSDAASVNIAMSGTGAAASGYSVSVQSVAQSQKLVTAGRASSALPVGQGQITFDFGTITGGTLDANGKYSGAEFSVGATPSKTVTIDPGATSLSDIRDAINRANIGVTASIVNDGSASPYRLVLTDSTTGKTNSMRITVDGDSALGDLLAHDPSSSSPDGQALTETRTAADAQFTVDGVRMTRSTNSITDVIDGATVTLVKPTSSAPVNLTVATNADGVATSVKKFVDAYNQVAQTLKNATAYDPTTKAAATLNGDATIRVLQAQLHSLLTTPLSGTGTPIGRLFDIGVQMKADGSLSLDNTKLKNVLSANPTSVASVFAEVGTPTDDAISFVTAGTKTTAGDYAVTIGKLATQGQVVGSAAAGLTVTAGQDDTLDISLNGVTATIKLSAGTYSSSALASELQSKINAAPAFSSAGLGVTVTAAGGVLAIRSTAYGSASTVGVSTSASSSNPALFFGSAPTAAGGSDVTGTINGVAAVGSGQFLTGATGDASEGLKLRVTGGQESVSRGSVHYAQGYAFQLTRALDQILGTDGAIANATKGFNASVTQLSKDRTAISTRLTSVEARLRKQYTALDTLMGQSTSTSSYLTQQFAALANQTSS
jgi:flagellar hook-associated protein 2